MQENNNSLAKKELNAWRIKHKVTFTDFAELIGVSYRTAWNLFKRPLKPTLEKAFKIEEVTKGLITPSMWLVKPAQNKDTKKSNRSKNKHAKKHKTDNG